MKTEDEIKAELAQCSATHSLIDNGAPCIWLEGHVAVGIQHTTRNGLSWLDAPEKNEEAL